MSQLPSMHSPFRDGFAALWHEPALLPAELAWRWCFGLSAWALGIYSVALFLDSLTIARSDEWLIRSFQPQLFDRALRHTLHGSVFHFVLEQSVLVVGIVLLWSLAATAGRAASFHRLVAMFSAEEEPQSTSWNFAPIFILTLLRALWSLIAFAVTLGALIYGLVMIQEDHALRAALLLSFAVGVAALTGVVLNWYFGIAPLFCIRENLGARAGLDRALAFSERNPGRLFLLGLAFLVLRLVWAATMCFAFLSPLRLVGRLGGGWVALLMALLALVYFGGADLLYLARLGAYASLAEDDAGTIRELPEVVPSLPPSIAEFGETSFST